MSMMRSVTRAYRDEIARLGERFGGYASFWLYCAERLIEDLPKEKFIPYPLWESAKVLSEADAR